MKFRMFARILLTLALFVFVACGVPSDKLIGKWGLDVEKFAELEEIQNLPEDQRKIALGMTKGLLVGVTLEFTADKVIGGYMGKKEEAPYNVKSQEGDKVVIEFTKDGKTRTMNCEFKGETLILGDGEMIFAFNRE